jgi:hypothetical protein
MGAIRGVGFVAVVALLLLPVQGRVAMVPAAAALFVPVVIAGVLGGWAAGLVTSVAGAVVLAIVLPPYWVPAVGPPADRVTLVAYATVAVLTGAALGRWANERRRAVSVARATIASSALIEGRGVLDVARWSATRRGARRRDVSAVPLRPLNAFFGHHKSGTSWVGDILEDLCDEVGWSHWATDNAGPFGAEGLERWAFRNRVDLVSWTNSDIRLVPDRPDLRAFHVVRDPRDVCVSAYFSHRNSHSLAGWPELGDVRAFLRRVDRDEGIAFEIDFLRPVFEAMEQWDYDRPTILELRFEDLVAAPEEHFVAIASFLGMVDPRSRVVAAQDDGPSSRLRRTEQRARRMLHLPPTAQISAAAVRRVVARHSFEYKSGGRAPGVVDATNHYRSGVAGDWKHYLTAEHLELLARRHPGLLDTLGYPPA